MDSFRVKPYETNLRGSFNFQNPRTNRRNNEITPAQQGQQTKVNAKLQINNQVDTFRPSSETEKVESEIEKVKNKVNSLTIATSNNLSKRISLNESMSEGIKQLKTLTSRIQNEANPLQKQNLIEDANSLLSELKSQYDKEVTKDPTLAENVSISSLVRPGEDIDGPKFSQVSISSTLSPSSSGLSSIDFSNTKETSEKLELSLEKYTEKEKSYQASNSELSGATSQAISQFEAQGEIGEIEREERRAKELEDQITNSTNRLLQSTNPNEDLVSDLIAPAEEEDKSVSSEDNQKTETKTSQALNQYSTNSSSPESTSLDLAV